MAAHDSLPLYEGVNRWRLVPRLLVLLYGLFCFYVGDWFMGLVDPTTQQSAFVSVVWGASAAWFGLYVNSGRSKG